MGYRPSRPRGGSVARAFRAAATALLIAVLAAGLSACDRKEAEFFKLLLEVQLDQTPPVFENFEPQGQHLYNTNVYRFRVRDPDGAPGEPISGVNPSSIRARYLIQDRLLPLTHVNDLYTGTLDANVGDGNVRIQLEASDQEGNNAELIREWVLKRLAGRIEWNETPGDHLETNAASLEVIYSGVVDEPYLGRAVGYLAMPGPDGEFDTSDDVIRYEVDLTEQVRETGRFELEMNLQNYVPVGGPPRMDRFRYVARIEDTAVDIDRAPNPNVATISHEFTVTWNPPPPPPPETGSIVGRVTAGGNPVADVAVTISGQAEPVITDANGDFRKDGLTPGTYLVTISGLPGDVNCSPTVRSTTVQAGQESRVDFDCTKQEPGFTISLNATYVHFQNSSRLCLIISTSPPQPGLAGTATVTGPGVLGSGQFAGSLNAQGMAFVIANIEQIGLYTWTVTFGSMSAQATVNVTGEQGTGGC